MPDDGQNAPENSAAGQDLPGLRAPLHLAQEMGQGLAERHLLLGALPWFGSCESAAVVEITGDGALSVTAETSRPSWRNPMVISVDFRHQRRSPRLTHPDSIAIYGSEMDQLGESTLPASGMLQRRTVLP